MNVKRFVGKNAREAMAQVRATWGDEAVVLSNRPIPGGVEILALPAMADVPEAAASARTPRPAPVAPMSTLSFEHYVRERQRQEQQELAPGEGAASASRSLSASASASSSAMRPQTRAVPGVASAATIAGAPAQVPLAAPPSANAAPRVPPTEPARFAASALREELGEELGEQEAQALEAGVQTPQAQANAAYVRTRDGTLDASEMVMSELRAMRGMISSQLASLSWFDSVRRSPVQTQLLRVMLANGFSPALARQLVQHLPGDRDEGQSHHWLSQVLARNLACAGEDTLAERGGVFALVGPTGVGKTTTTAKIAAGFAMRHGAASIGLISADTYRMAASDQLAAFGRLLNIPVHTARDAVSLADLLDLFEKKKLVLIDTVGMGQRDRRMRELFDALPSHRVQRLLVLNAAAQAETLDEVVQAYGAGPGTRCVISKLDEAVKCGAVVDVAIRRKLRVEGIANGQRVPEDWHAARAPLLVHKALARQGATIFMPDDGELALMLTGVEAASSRPTSQVRHA